MTLGVAYCLGMNQMRDISVSQISAIRAAATAIGGIAALSRAIGVSPPTVHQWAHDGRPVPIQRCIQIEKATGGKVKCEDIRPDVDWAYLRNSSPPEAA